MDVAQKRWPAGRIVSLLEGGYDLEGLARSVGGPCRRADGRLTPQPSIGSTGEISMPKPERPTYLRGLPVRRRIERTPRSRRICAPRPTSRHCVARVASDRPVRGRCEVGRHAGAAVAQVDEHAAPLLLEALQNLGDDAGAENVADDVGAMQARRHIAPVADRAVDEGEMEHRVEAACDRRSRSARRSAS